MSKIQCKICGWFNDQKLCKKHRQEYIWDSTISGFRLKKRLRGSRYTNSIFHNTEIKVTKSIESYFGKINVVTSYHPIWAVSKKNVLYEFDIFIKNTNFLIEYNGDQHYTRNKFFQKTKKEFKEQVSRDKHKAKLAKLNGFKLIIFNQDDPLIEDYIINKIKGNI